jgi:hypothetical protein
MVESRSPSILKPASIGGGLAGLVGGLPIIGALNCACCALVVGGGFLASFLFSRTCQGAGVAFRAGTGAKVGALAGLFYAVVHGVVGSLFQLAFRTDPEEILAQMEQGGLPPEYLETAESIVRFLTSSGGMVAGFIGLLVVGVIFSTIGGLIGGAAFKVEPAPPAEPVRDWPAPPEP